MTQGSLRSNRLGQSLLQSRPQAFPTRTDNDLGPSESESAMIEWNARLALDNAALDGEHHHLVDLVNRVLDDLGNSAIDAPKKAGFESLIDFSREHFASEERLMMGVGYCDAASHICQHGHLIKEIEQLWADVRSGRQLADPTTVAYLHVWMVDHIQTFDKRLAAFLKARASDSGIMEAPLGATAWPAVRLPRRQAR